MPGRRRLRIISGARLFVRYDVDRKARREGAFAATENSGARAPGKLKQRSLPIAARQRIQ